MLISISQSHTPLSPHTPVVGKRPILLERFSDNSAYSLNQEHPSGVFYLRPGAADRLVQALSLYGNPPARSIAGIVSRSPDEEALFKKLLDPGADQPSFTSVKQLNVWFHISNSCNLSCSYCYIPHLRKAVAVPAQETVMTGAVLSAVIKNLFQLCVDRHFNSLRIRFAGGEPLLALDSIEQACRIATTESEATGIGVTFGILTNGTIISERWLQLLATFDFRGISISIDGMDAPHDKYRFRASPDTRERTGTWDTIFRNITILKENGHSPYILTTLTPTNYSTIDEFVDRCVDRRLGFRLSPVRDTKTASIPGLQHAMVKKLEPIYASLPARLPISRPIQNFANFAEWSPNVKKSTACGTCRTSMAVGQHGDVSTCQMRLETSYGNMATEPAPVVFERMVGDPANWRFVNPALMTGGCSQCLWRYSCSGGCPEHTLMNYQTYDSPSPWCRVYGDFLPTYIRSIAMQIKIEADRRASS